MNYLTQITGFERWLETNYLPISSQLLWYKLIGLCNRCGWAEWVVVDNQRLMAVMQIKREATFISTRDRLIAAGLIEYRKGKKGSPNRYKICTFKNEVQTVVKSEVQTVVNTVVNTVDINKQNETKQKKDTNVSKEIFSAYTQNQELLTALREFAAMRVKIKKPMTDRAKTMLLSELDKLAAADSEKIEILMQSVYHSWQSVYALKAEKQEGWREL